jgi:hypothetical protein
MPYTGDKLHLLERLGTDAIKGDRRSAEEFVAHALAELDRVSDEREKLAGKAVSILAHVPDTVKVGEIQDTLAAFRFWRASQSSEYWQCPCGCKSFYPIERTVCPDSGHMRAQAA